MSPICINNSCSDADSGLILPPWVDLRLGGDLLPGLRTDVNTTTIRDAAGMNFSTTTVNSSWVKFEDQAFSRSGKTLEFVATIEREAFFPCIQSDETDEGSNAQLFEAEIGALIFPTATIGISGISAFFGNDGTPGVPFTNIQEKLADVLIEGDPYKFVFQNETTINFQIYKLPSAAEADWDDISDLVTSASFCP